MNLSGTMHIENNTAVVKQEYRSYGLQQATHPNPSTFAVHVTQKLDNYGSKQAMQQLLRCPASEYRNQGLKNFHGQPVTVAPAVESRNTITAAVDHSSMTNVDSYDETTTLLVNRYLSLPRTMITPRELPLTGRGSFASASNYASDIRLPADNVRYYPPMFAPHALSGHNYLHQHPGDKRGRSSSSVLPQYPFSGPPASRRRNYDTNYIIPQ
ncbi:putative gibberellin receptor GID1B-like isoform 1 [Capsicum annuum]|nr:putative gibberellin receptor GID1B-like isoform 1 [Capsicum annuum]